MDIGTPSKLVKKISQKMHKEHNTELFRGGDLRRTCETLLASLGVSKEIRAQLLSHGRSQLACKQSIMTVTLIYQKNVKHLKNGRLSCNLV